MSYYKNEFSELKNNFENETLFNDKNLPYKQKGDLKLNELIFLEGNKSEKIDTLKERIKLIIINDLYDFTINYELGFVSKNYKKDKLKSELKEFVRKNKLEFLEVYNKGMNGGLNKSNIKKCIGYLIKYYIGNDLMLINVTMNKQQVKLYDYWLKVFGAKKYLK